MAAAFSIVVSPDHSADHANFDKTSNTNFQALSSARQDYVGIKLAELAALAPHMPFDVPKGNVTDKLCKVAG
ncbi:hypothetical protein X740_18970 [Mesorhizobium sp. LNHC221B00]|uniref:hypothetical protein n=1 Tax=Mesorhizobium sp. LNHC221B00 TaxID=1287233 RepID=UPI0003CDEBB8|nr:hypothetical protein [Mesorhizobium sp. LNHC221B00]ESY78828.1 hypothetical protein X740_18970 [Mesorhizobium sp. LNHC221B00]